MKIGIFDSGLGGLTVFKEISKRLPSFEIIYLGDTARLPYGIKSKKTVDKYSENNLKFLRSLGCQVIVIACNTASSYSTGLLKKKFRIPIFDVLSSGVTASLKTDSNRIGIIGTSSTIESKTYQKTKQTSRSFCYRFFMIFSPTLGAQIHQKSIKETIKTIIKNDIDF